MCVGTWLRMPAHECYSTLAVISLLQCMVRDTYCCAKIQDTLLNFSTRTLLCGHMKYMKKVHKTVNR